MNLSRSFDESPGAGEESLSRSSPRLRFSREIALLGLILLTAAGLRLWGLREIPPGLRYDELLNAGMAGRLLRGERVIYFTAGWGREPLYYYLVAGAWALLGESGVVLRLVSALSGVVGLITTYLLIRRLMGVSVALLTAAGLAGSFVPLYFGRVGLRAITLPLLTTAATYALWRGLEPLALGCEDTPPSVKGSPHLASRWSWFTLGGLTLGLALYTYQASRLVPLALFAFVVYLILFHRRAMRSRWRGVFLSFALAALVGLPLAVYLGTHPGAEQRLMQLSGPLVELRRGNPGPLLHNAWATATMFIGRGDRDWLYNIPGRPFFPWPVAVLFYAGIGIAVRRWRDPAYILLLLLLLGGLAPGLLSDTAPSFVHTINILPVVYVFPALSLMEGERWLVKRHPSWRPWLIILLVGLTCLHVIRDVHTYFLAWARHPEVRARYGAPVLEAARYLEAHPQLETVCISGAAVDYWNPWERQAMALTLRRQMSVRWFNGENSFLVPAGEGPVWYIVLDSAPVSPAWADFFSSARLIERVSDFNGEPLFTVYQMAERETAARTLTTTGRENPIRWSPETTFPPDDPEGLRRPLLPPVDVGHTVQLLGYTINGDTHHPGEVVILRTFWRVLAPTEPPLAVFVHLLDEAGTVRSGWDDLDVPPESWASGDVFSLLHHLPVPADASPGVYQVEIGWYSPVTMQRLPIFAAGVAVADRLLLQPVTLTKPQETVIIPSVVGRRECILRAKFNFD